MHHCYDDIMDSIDKEPLWFDEHAVPRYCEFSPQEVADIYCQEAALVLIGCQSCGRLFKVAFTTSRTDVWVSMMQSDKYYQFPTDAEKEAYLNTAPEWPLAASAGHLHYGDPPNVRCCAAGPTMNCDDFKVLEYWRSEAFHWVRHSEFEVLLPDHPEYGI